MSKLIRWGRASKETKSQQFGDTSESVLKANGRPKCFNADNGVQDVDCESIDPPLG